MAGINVIKFRVSTSFIVLTFFMLLIRQSYLFAMYIIAVVLHEFAHAICARSKGFRTNEIVLSAFGAVLYGEFDGISEKDEILIALAGPFSNLCFAALTAALWWFVPPSYVFTEEFFFSNIAVCLTNLLPCYPLDGGRALLALLRHKHNAAKSARILRKIGIGLSFSVFALFLFTWIFAQINLTFGLFSVFLFANATAIIRQNMWTRVAYGHNIKKRLEKGMEIKRFVLSENATVAQLMKLRSHRHLTEVVVVDSRRKTVKVIPFGDVDDILLKNPLDARLKTL